jgi:hypothetical protein
VESSSGIAIVRETAIWWRVMQIEALCPLVSSILKHYGLVQDAVTVYFNTNRTSPYAEELSEGFLKFLCHHADPLVRSMAALELAILRVRCGAIEPSEVLFDRNPDHVFLAIKSGGRIPGTEPNSLYRVRVARELPGLLQCIRESTR